MLRPEPVRVETPRRGGNYTTTSTPNLVLVSRRLYTRARIGLFPIALQPAGKGTILSADVDVARSFICVDHITRHDDPDLASI